jgi:hypothetical protein
MVESRVASIRRVGAVGLSVALTASCAPAGRPPAAPEPPPSQPTAAEGQPPKPSLAKTYTAKEREQLTFCIGLSETARRVAAEKVRGSPIEDVKKFYEGKPNARLNVATVEDRRKSLQ